MESSTRTKEPVLPLLSTEEMRAADARAVARRGVDALVAAAGTAVGLEAQRLLGRCYGARVAVVVGPGLNGADGRVAARRLSSRGRQGRRDRRRRPAGDDLADTTW